MAVVPAAVVAFPFDPCGFAAVHCGETKKASGARVYIQLYINIYIYIIIYMYNDILYYILLYIYISLSLCAHAHAGKNVKEVLCRILMFEPYGWPCSQHFPSVCAPLSLSILSPLQS